LNLLKTQSLTSDEIAHKLSLSKQDTRTYLQRLKKKEKIKTLGKRGRKYIYTYRDPTDSEKSQIDTNMLVEVLKDYLESEPSFKKEVKNKIAELEAKLNTLASKTNENYDEIEEELEMLQKIEHPERRQAKIPDFLTRQMFDSNVLDNLDNILKMLIDSIPEVNAAALVSTEGEILASVMPKNVEETTIAVMIAALLSLAESAINLIKHGEFEQLFIRGNDGYLLVLPAGPNGVLSVSTSRDVRLGLIFTDCMRISEQLAKLI
jgi:predicted regulator of Ras-like GTPase activity (Roadblock/LC7/MglB family)